MVKYEPYREFFEISWHSTKPVPFAKKVFSMIRFLISCLVMSSGLINAAAVERVELQYASGPVANPLKGLVP